MLWDGPVQGPEDFSYRNSIKKKKIKSPLVCLVYDVTDLHVEGPVLIL